MERNEKGQFKKGMIPWNRKEHLKKECPKCGKVFWVKQCLARIVCCSQSCALSIRPKTEKWREACRKAMKGNTYAKGRHPGNWQGFAWDNGYKMVMTKDGYKREHIKIIEEKIGRVLKNNEVVHHWNINKIDNRFENLCLFRNQSAHKRLHHFAKRHGININLLRFEQPWLFGSI